MHPPSDPRFEFCPHVGKRVGVCRSEGECRREFGCTEQGCPLEASFGLKAFDVRMRGYATELDLWPVDGAPTPDT